MSNSNSATYDTSFRSALDRMIARGRLEAYTGQINPHLDVAAALKKRDGGPALMFTSVQGYEIPIIGNLLCCQSNCEAAFGIDVHEIRNAIGRGFSSPIAPVLVNKAAAQEGVHTDKIDLARILPVLFHTPQDAGRFITGGVVIVRDPDTGIYNASFHRLQLIGPNRTAIKLDYGRHLRLTFERAKRSGIALPIVVCIGADLALQYTAATMGSQMPENADELAAAGGFCGRPLAVVKAVTQDLLVPAETEIVLEGHILPDQTTEEGPFGEFVGYLSPANDSPIFEITAVTHRERPLYQVINGYSLETTMLRKYVLEASLLKVLQAASPIVVDAEMTGGGLHRFHAVLQVRKSSAQHDGLQRNAILAAFGALKDLDLIIAVDDDIDIRNPQDVEYAVATRMEASRDLFVIPDARGHEYVRVSANGIRAKVGIDATVAFEEKSRFQRCAFTDVALHPDDISAEPTLLRKYIGR
jgi:2,5-furandicarboxylate decarboxylase 1